MGNFQWQGTSLWAFTNLKEVMSTPLVLRMPNFEQDYFGV